MSRPFAWATLREDYERLGNAKAVAAEYGCDYSGVVKALKRNGIPIRPRYPYKWDNLERDIKRLGSVRAVARAYGCTPSSADSQARSRGISVIPALEKTGGKAARGRRAELLALSILPGAVDLNGKELHAAYDLRYHGLKIDVKSSLLTRSRGHHGWRFQLNGKKHLFDAVLCLGMSESGDRAVCAYLMPTAAIPGQSARIAPRGSKRFRQYQMELPEEVRNAHCS